MRILFPATLCALALFTAACDELPVDDPDTCGRAAFTHFVGEPVEVLDVIRFSQPVRIIPHDGVVTLEFNPDRINFKLDRHDIIVEVTCG